MLAIVFSQDPVGPYTIALAVTVMVGLPVMARYLRNSVKLEAGPLKAQLGQITQTVGAPNGTSIHDQLYALEVRIDRESATRRAREAQITQQIQEMSDALIILQATVEGAE